jgi:hypothetical protein
MTDKNNNDHYEGALLEDMNHKFDVILEYLTPLASVPSDVAQLKDDMTVVKADIKTIKAVVTNHEGRITKIERVI